MIAREPMRNEKRATSHNFPIRPNRQIRLTLARQFSAGSESQGGQKPEAAGVDKWVRGEPHASDHVPTWIEFANEAFQLSSLRRRKPDAAREDDDNRDGEMRLPVCGLRFESLSLEP